MNDYFTEINSSKYLLLTKIFEPFENCLELEITIPFLGNKEIMNINGVDLGLLDKIEYNENSPKYKVTFDNYITYSVINESYDIGGENNKFSFKGNLFRVFEESYFIEYLSYVTYATPINNIILKHYQFVALNHIINIASIYEPLIEKIN